MSSYPILQCIELTCRFRFPDIGTSRPDHCPRCGGPLQEVDIPSRVGRVDVDESPHTGPAISILLDNLRSAFNVGGILRTADGAGLEHAYLCGITSTPDNPKVSKTGLSAEFAIPWSYHPNAVDIAHDLRDRGMRLWALEGGPDSRPIFDTLPIPPGGPLVLIAGNELAGTDPGLVELCDRIVYLPMQGFKRSLNVAIAAGIAIYLLRFNGGSDARRNNGEIATSGDLH